MILHLPALKSCHLSSCWVNKTIASVVRVLGLVLIPVNQLVQSCPPHPDFGIIAAIVATIVTAVTPTTAARIAISQMVAVASTVDPLAGQVDYIKRGGAVGDCGPSDL